MFTIHFSVPLDRPGLTESKKVEKLQSEILQALEKQLKQTHPNDSQ